MHFVIVKTNKSELVAHGPFVDAAAKNLYEQYKLLSETEVFLVAALEDEQISAIDNTIFNELMRQLAKK